MLASPDAGAGSRNFATVDGLLLVDGSGGGRASNYTLVGGDHSITIKPRTLILPELKVHKTEYDGLADATVIPGVLAGTVGKDDVRLAGGNTAEFDDPGAGENKMVTVSGLVLEGRDKHNYRIAPQIRVMGPLKELEVSGLAVAAKTYDGTSRATLRNRGSLRGVVKGDQVRLVNDIIASFADAEAGANKIVNITGLALEGRDKDNYRIAPEMAVTATINKKVLSLPDFQGLDRPSPVAEDDQASVLNGELEGVVEGDAVALDSDSIEADFGDGPASGGNDVITIRGLRLSGIDAGNYTLPAELAVTARLLPMLLRLVNLGVDEEAYDGETEAETTIQDLAPPETSYLLQPIEPSDIALPSASLDARPGPSIFAHLSPDAAENQALLSGDSDR